MHGMTLSLIVMLGVEVVSVHAGQTPECLNPGPDVIIKSVSDAVSWGSVGDVAAFSLGTEACNIGDDLLPWDGDTPDHPVIDSAIFRVHEGRLEQIGLAWLKHGYGAAQEDTCGCDCVPGDWENLGVGCSDTYNAGINGLQSIAGGRLEVNPWTGVFPFPPSQWGQTGNAIFRRLQVHHGDIDPFLNLGASYIGQVHFVTPADAAAGNQRNNHSTCPVSFTHVGGAWTVALEESTSPATCAVQAWQVIDPDVVVTVVEGATGRLAIGARVHEEEGGWYRYEYAVQNLDEARAVSAFSVPCVAVASIDAPRFHDVAFHGGEDVDGVDWVPVIDEVGITWTLPEGSINAIHWGTAYSFGFMANVEPVEGDLDLTYWAPGLPGTTAVSTLIPRQEAVDPCTLPSGPCPADVDGDLLVGVNDVLGVLEGWGDCGDGTWQPAGDIDQDCCVTVSDVLVLLEHWGLDCRPRGACCLPDGGCEGDRLETDCLALDGAWRGEGISCSEAQCPSPVACCFAEGPCVEDIMPGMCVEAGGVPLDHGASCLDCPLMADDCDDAVPADDGIWAFTTIQATTDGPIHPECKTSDGGITGNDIWMRYTALDDGLLVVSTCDSADYDTDLVIYDGIDCDALMLLGCNDDAAWCAGWTSHVEVSVVGGQEYLVRLGGWEEGSVGTGVVSLHLNTSQTGACCLGGELCQDTFEDLCGGTWMGEGTSCLSVNCPSVPNDDCSGAVPIDLGSTGFDTRLATTDGPVHPECKKFDGGVTGNDVWYLFTAPDTGTLTVSTCNTADYDSDLIVYDGVDCADLVLLGCNDDTEGCDGYTSHVEVPVEMGASYLIRVGGWQEGSVGTGTLLLHLDSGG